MSAGPSSTIIPISTPLLDGDVCCAPAMNPSESIASSSIVSSCPDCGKDVVHPYLKEFQEAQARVSELEQQIKVLTLRATNAMERATEYETSLKRMNSLTSAGRSTPDPHTTRPSTAPATQILPNEIVASPERASSRLARLLPTRMPSLRSTTSSPTVGPLSPPRSTPPAALAASALPREAPRQFPMLSHTPPTPTVDGHAHTSSASLLLPGNSNNNNNIAITTTTATTTATAPSSQPSGASPDTTQLLSQLSQEQDRRRAAEAEAHKTKSEIEELTGQLFEQANQMVADERRARAKLEARVEVLERRDGEKTRRLSVLEMRIQRVERVRELLAGGALQIQKAGSADTVGKAGSPGREIGVGA